ncbi:E3 ubiquitin-protein ligase E3D [Procambarus clarkii]|uniref:E3 ubiquitin-protein ligase E3D n=1 Tax=Procambarus clarkii TaxID=6728 RepID=UPI0037440BC9
MSRVLIEVLPNIQACNMYITLPPDTTCQKILVDKSECSVELQDGNIVCLKIPRGTYLVSNSVTGITQVSNIITARAQISEMTSLITALGGNILNDGDTKFLDTELNTSLSGSLVSARCKKCLTYVFSNVKFRRVMPLPSVDWDHSSEDWFCHLHAEHGNKLKPTSLQPNPDECFYTELFFLVHSNLLECMNAECDDSIVKCSKCRVLLGEKANLSVKVWTLSLEWVTQQDKTIYNRNSAEILISLFHNIDKDNFGVNCRLVLQAQTNPNKYLYMVTMNMNQKLLVSDISEFASCETMLQESYGDREGMHCNSSKKLCLEKRKDISLKKIYAIKLLYLVKKGEDSQTGEWVDDINVHIIPCSISLLDEVKTMLEKSTYFLPDNVKTIENMNLGYIIK